MEFNVLSEQQVEQFIELGWVKVEEAFAREYALQAQDMVWTKVEERGIKRNDPATWTEPMVRVNEMFNTEPFRRCNSRRLAGAIEDLVGEGRWATRSVYGETEQLIGYGWWPVNFSLDADKPWSVPSAGWHWDGIHFRHHIDSPDQGLLCLCLFSEIAPRGGGTLVAEGSHKVVAKYLNRFPDGIALDEAIRELNREHSWLSELTTPLEGASREDAAAGRIRKFMQETYTDQNGIRLRVVETTGEPGDVFLCHPFLYHTSSQNCNGVPRFMCNRTTPLMEKLRLSRLDESQYSPLERSIRLALAGSDSNTGGCA